MVTSSRPGQQVYRAINNVVLPMEERGIAWGGDLRQPRRGPGRGGRGGHRAEGGDAPEVYESTRVIFAKDLGLDMAPAKLPLDAPQALPDYVSGGDNEKPEEDSSGLNSSSLSSGSSW